MDHPTRFVFAGPCSWPLERAMHWAVEHGFTRIDFNADSAPNYPATFTPERAAPSATCPTSMASGSGSIPSPP